MLIKVVIGYCRVTVNIRV